MKIALVPLNPTVGNLSHNIDKILSFTDQSIQKGCDLVIFPELSLIGYPPKDYLYYKILLDQQSRCLTKLKRKSKKITIIVGGIAKNPGKGLHLRNTAFILQNGQQYVYSKELLPNYDVFDEYRYFEPGSEPLKLKINGKKFGITVCEDIWSEETKLISRYHGNPLNQLAKLNLDYLVNISASPFELDKVDRRKTLLSSVAQGLNANVIYVNQSGANDDLVFDGGAFVYNPQGKLLYQTPEFDEDLFVFDSEINTSPIEYTEKDPNELLEKALVIGTRDYVHKTGFKQVVIGLSGGIDSALVTYLATKALGPENVLAVTLPSRYSSKGSVVDSDKLAKTLGITIKEFEIDPIHKSFEELFGQLFDNQVQDITNQNIQARIRGNILMAISNNSGRLLLNTTNKSEMAMGYGTLYGDMCGALAVIIDLTKTQVYDLANYINREQEIIPKEIIEKHPSAELKPDQKDVDTLPPYSILDPMIEDIITNHEIKITDDNKQYPTKEILRKILLSEYKRYQAPPGLKVTGKAFGTGRRIPIAAKLEV